MANLETYRQGHDEEFLDENLRDFECSICQLVYRDVVQLTDCGHCFCKDCIMRVQRELDSICPLCNHRFTLDGIFEDKGFRRRVLSLRVKCREHEAGCSWTGELRDIEVNYLAHMQTCPCQMVSCTNQGCTLKVRRRDLNSHQQDVCEWRLVECTYCRVTHPHAEQQLHNDQCSKFPLVCSQCQQQEIAREQMHFHINNDCSETIVSCPFENFGCTSREKRSCLLRHIDAETNHHLTMACNKVLRLEEEMKSQQQVLDRMQAMEQRMQAQEQLNKDKDQKTKELEQQVQVQKQHIQAQEQRIQAQEQLNIFQARCLQLQNGAVERVSATCGKDTALHAAARDGDVIKIRQLLTTGGAINAGKESGETPLMLAALKRRAEAVNCLLINGADYSLVNSDGGDALHYAALGGDPNTITTLISAGAYPNTRSNEGYTPLMAAACNDDADALDTLAAAGGDMCSTNDNGWSPVHFAAANNKVNILEKLVVSYHCNIHTKTNYGYTPLRIARDKNHKEAIDYLQANGGTL